MEKFRVNDIFYSLQGEGHNTGRAAVFIRFSGCNLHCSFCDTDFADYRELTTDDIIRQIADYPARFVVLTGGEPSLQVTFDFIDRLHREGYEVAMESNGTHQPPENLDWLTVSPKVEPTVKRCQELKVLFDGKVAVSDWGITADYYYLQPCDTGDPLRNEDITLQCIEYIKTHPRWRLSLQTHKMIGFK